jgi:hypothetical protein
MEIWCRRQLIFSTYLNNSAKTERNKNNLLREAVQEGQTDYLTTLTIAKFYGVMKYVYGELVEWYWQGKTYVLGEKPVPAPLWPPKNPHGLAWDRTWSSELKGRQLTSWAVALLSCINIIFKVGLNIFHVYTNAIRNS